MKIFIVLNREKRKILLFLVMFVVIKCVVFSENSVAYSDDNIYRGDEITKYFDRRKSWNLSNLGNVLFLNSNPRIYENPIRSNKTYEILIWKYFDWLQNRHVKQFGSSSIDPLSNCSVKNCIFTGDDNKMGTADAVVIHLQHGLLPLTINRPKTQRWIFLSDEAPTHTFTMSKVKDWTKFAGVFNWSMTYRSNSDIPVPYGRVIPLTKVIDKNTSISNIVPNWKSKKRDVLVSILMSNCLKFRMDYITQLNKYLKVDVYGRCSKEYSKSCPGHFRADCGPVGDYLFYLVLENSKCKEYITEKAFYNAYSKGAIPIILGPTVEECEGLLPPKSFLHIDNYSSPKHLAEDIVNISEDENKYLSYHAWRQHFEVLNEHGYFKTASKHFCRICEGLNYNVVGPKVYDTELLGSFLDSSLLCR